jgi:uncharacterized protein
VTLEEVALGILAGLTAGVFSGLFGVGGGTVATPAISILLDAPPIVAIATPLPVIFPTAIVGAATYARAGEIDLRAALWMSVTGAAASVGGALVAEVVDGRLLLIATALLLAREAIQVARNKGARQSDGRPASMWAYAGIGVFAGFASGLLGIGGGLVMVPLLAGVLGMPLKRALGTSLAAIVALVVPGTIAHAALGNIDWSIFAVLAVGSVIGARIGATIALSAKERTLRLAVGAFLGLVAIGYGATELVNLLRTT